MNLGLIRTLLFRCFSLVSDFSKFHEEVSVLKSVLSKNGFPSALVDSCINSFLNKIFTKKLIVDTVAKKEVFIVLPFLGSTSLKCRTRLMKVFRKHLPF